MIERLARFLRSRLSRPYLPLHLAILAILLTLPALATGWQLDDHVQRLALSGRAGADLPPGEIFSTLKGDPAANWRRMDLGFLPWWTAPELRLSFFRPLSVASMRMDYLLWPRSAFLMHLHSLLWLGTLVCAAALLYREILGPGWVAGLAALLYAVDDAHAFPAAWLANRNALIAVAFGILSIAAHHRWRRGGGWLSAAGSAALLALSLASGEMGLGAAAYLAAYALCLEGGGPRRKLLSLLPSGAVLLGWAAAYRLLGHGVQGSGMYLDPLASPLAFASAFTWRAPFLLLGQWLPLPADLGALLPDGAAFLGGAAALLLLAPLAVVLAPLLRRDSEARFWAAGMLLALLPVSSTLPSNRLLFFVGLGAMALLAKFLSAFAAPSASLEAGAPTGLLARGTALVMAGTHLVLAPLFMPLGAYLPKLWGESIVRAAESLPADPALRGQELIVANAPDYLLDVSYLPAVRILEGRPPPGRLRALSAGPGEVELRRVDARTLWMRAEGGTPRGPLGSLFRAPGDPLRPGDRVDLSGFTAEVERVTRDGRPLEVLFTFGVPLEDGSLRWVRWQKGRFVAMKPPAAGETLSLAPARGPMDF